MKGRRIGVLLAAGALFLTMASTALADSTFPWGGNGYPNQTCSANSATMLWVWTGDNPTSLTINGQLQSGSWVKQGGGSSAWHFVTSLNGTNYPPTSASITYTGSDGTLTLSHCDGTQTTTTTTSSTTTTTPTTTTTSSTTTTTTTTTPTTTTTSSSITTSSSSTQSTTSTVSTETTSSTSSTSTVTTATPQGSVEAETGKPVVTPPSTDALGAASSTPSGAWNVLLALGAVLSLSILVLTPMAKSRRRK